MHQIFPESPFYHIAQAYRLRGGLDIPALESAFTDLLVRHDVLRSSYGSGKDGAPAQAISPPWNVRFPVTEITGSSDQDRMTKAQQAAREHGRTLFDLNSGPVIRLDLFTLAGQEVDHAAAAVVHDQMPDAIVKRAGDDAPLSYAQRGLWFLNQLQPQDTAYQQG
jgi:hypothetical protein